MQKKAIRYHRFSKDGQSTGSIERQEIVTNLWVKNNEVLLLDTFRDDGYTATNFDRPDIKNLFSFIKKHSGNIDYLLVAELTRFSRELGDAINMVKEIQLKHGIKIVSCSRNMIYDVKEPTSFFMMSIEFTIGNTDNLKRESDINGGIYTAKAKEGRFIGSMAPYGYYKKGDAKKLLAIHETEAAIVAFIFSSYLSGLPLQYIYLEACKKGFCKKGNSVIQKMLSNPIYIAYQQVKPWKDHPGGLLPGKWEPVIDLITWHQVQQKLTNNKSKGITVSDSMPLRGILHCSCGRALTGAPSRGKLGGYYNYYKCNAGPHTNISATYAHNQMNEVMQYLSLPGYYISAIEKQSNQLLEINLTENRKKLATSLRQLELIEIKLISIEEKYIANQLAYETYCRHYNDSTNQRLYLKATIENLQRDKNEVHALLQSNLYNLTDMQFLYSSACTADKQQLLRLVFDNKLYYQHKVYRTPYLMEIFHHNLLILKQKKLLELDKKRDYGGVIPLGGAAGSFIEPLTTLLQLISKFKTA